MKAEFVELPAFARHRERYLADAEFHDLQLLPLLKPEAGEVVEGTGGLRKLRFADRRRSKGKRGGLRVLYFWWKEGSQFWLFTIYDKGEMSDLTAAERKLLRTMIKRELECRRAQ